MPLCKSSPNLKGKVTFMSAATIRHPLFSNHFPHSIKICTNIEIMSVYGLSETLFSETYPKVNSYL
jgi:hypothetical protein